MGLKIRYLSNMGVSIEGKHNKVLVDAFCIGSEANFIETSESIKNSITRNVPPFDCVNYMLFTHNHEDHFHAKSVYNYLENRKNKNTKIILTTDSEKLLNKFENRSFSTIPISLKTKEKNVIQADGFTIKMYGMKHEGRIFENVENIAFLVDIDGKKVLHVGDASPYSENFKSFDFEKEKIDLLIAPFPYLNMKTGQEIIKQYIKPKMVLITHLPVKKNDIFGWRECANKKLKEINKLKVFIASEENNIFYLR